MKFYRYKITFKSGKIVYQYAGSETTAKILSQADAIRAAEEWTVKNVEKMEEKWRKNEQ